MALLTRREELLAAWRALAGRPVSEGWRTIAIASTGRCALLAGRHFPGDEEALIVGFPSVRVPPPDQLPSGHGFRVAHVTLGSDAAPRVWVALCLQSPNGRDLFMMMAEDVLSTLEDSALATPENLLQAFLARIRAWQEFMRRGGHGVLSPDQEVGLFGELELLSRLVLAGVPPTVAVEAWQGPLDAVHDFVMGTGAIEVKSTSLENGFPATIASLDQLDDSHVRPLFLAALRLALETGGRTIADAVADLRDLLGFEPTALASFNSRLVHAGYIDAAADNYRRRFAASHCRVLRVTGNFPRITRGNIAIEIRSAIYQLDLDLISCVEVGFTESLIELGVSANGAC